MKTILKALLGVIATAVVIIVIVVPIAVVVSNKPKWIHLDKYMIFRKKEQDQRPTFQLDDYLSGNYRYKSYNLRWISENEYLHKNKEGNVIRYNLETQKSSNILFNTTFEQVKAGYYMVSPDEKYALLESNFSKLWRHSYTASYSIFDLNSSTFVKTSLPQQIQYITWAPVGHTLVYVWNNNIYFITDPTSSARSVTDNGEENKIYNGIPDWIYEEEMLSSNNALWWSPNGRFFAYGEFNDTLVPLIEYSFYGDGQYPKTVEIPYPKAGSVAPTVRLYIVDAKNLTAQELSAPEEFHSSNYYLSVINWVTDERISVQWIERRQNHSILTICDLNTSNDWSCSKDHQFPEMSTTGWIGAFRPSEPFFEADNISFYKVFSDKDGYKHIHRVAGTPPIATQITSGKWEVTSIVTLAENTLYYISNEYEKYPGRRNLYKIKIGTSSLKSQCITCELMKERCQYNSVYFSRNGKYYMVSCYGPGMPIFILYNASNSKEVKVLEDNKKLEEHLQNIQMPTKILQSLELDGTNYWYQMILPPHFDKSKKYPLLIDVYGGPCSQKADARFSIDWATFLASTEQIIVASFDGRGSGYQGDKIMHALYRRLGTYEVEDQIRATRKFIEMGFIDQARIAIWGWSYGGYVTSMVLGADSKVFRCGIAVAPVSNWTYYDNMYTERYMGYPTENDNLQFYKNSTVMERAENFRFVNYLLIHGTADDNVHFQQAAQISKALVDKEVDFQAMWYTDKDHGLSGFAYSHLYIHMTHFLQQCFAP